MEYRTDILRDLRVEINKEKNEAPLFLGLTIFVLILLTFLFLIPTVKEINTLKTEIQELEGLQTKYKNVLISYEKAAAYNEKISPYKDRLLERVPKEPNSIEAFDILDFTAKINNLRLNRLTTQQTLDNAENFSMAFLGGYSDIEKFFKELKTSKRFFSINEISIKQVNTKKRKDTGEQNKLFLNLVISSWFLNEQ